MLRNTVNWKNKSYFRSYSHFLRPITVKVTAKLHKVNHTKGRGKKKREALAAHATDFMQNNRLHTCCGNMEKGRKNGA